MYEHGSPATLAAIIDGEMGTVGDPKLDLAPRTMKSPSKLGRTENHRIIPTIAAPLSTPLSQRYGVAIHLIPWTGPRRTRRSMN
jgi:aminoglycoside phosphotransferase (APT) family kinase protein